MDFLNMINVLIGIVFIYFVLSLIVSAAVEGVSQWRGHKNGILKTATQRIFYNTKVEGNAKLETTLATNFPLVDEFFAHDRIQSLKQKDQRNPSEIPVDVYAKVLLEVVSGMGIISIKNSPWTFRQKIEDLGSDSSHEMGRDNEKQVGDNTHKESSLSDIKKTLLRLYDESNGDIDSLLLGVQQWVNEVQARASGWYKRKQQFNVFIFGFIVALVMNADTIVMFQKLSKNPQLQQQIIEQAAKLRTTDTGLTYDDLSKAKEYALDVSPLLGWDKDSVKAGCQSCVTDGFNWDCIWPWFYKLIGILLTACALLMGAPFWYDILQKILKARQMITGKSDEKPSDTGATPIAGATTLPNALSGDVPMFNPLATQLDYGNAFWLGRFSDLAYSEKDVAEGKCKSEQWGFELDGAGLERNEGKRDTQYLIAHNDKAIVLAFRGSEQNVQDWLGNFDMKQIGWEQGTLKVHEGFKSNFDAVKEDICSAIEKLMEQPRPLWVTGHSLGGALAVIAAYYLATTKKYRIAGLYTFGQPRCASPELAAAIKDKFYSCYWRVVNHRDPVPRVPPPRIGDMKYQHAGTVLYINELNQIKVDPPVWYEVLDGLDLPVSSGKLDKDTIMGVCKNVVGDHEMPKYLARLLAEAQRNSA